VLQEPLKLIKAPLFFNLEAEEPTKFVGACVGPWKYREPLQTIEHVIMHCPNYTAAHHKLLTDKGRSRSFPQLFENPKREELLRFLEET
jgi:hypothetical protein